MNESRIGATRLKITVRLFASYKEKAGTSLVNLELPDGATVGVMTREIVRNYPQITKNPNGLVVAVNEEYRDHNYVLNDGDEAALIPPVSGGSND